ncbi:NDMA-dependent alcohol dehydrogenase [Rhodococcus triatomae]|uniref:NDMA-dependent alcohol dehydrogenase n=1 Tax=Rhodococcus triatomae TaxID=300028 RepID=UPI000933C2C8|nr:NDMA-dependent alcohol dehydrogenase [Rhodococcus triatomae]QNG18450.1 NDMA-dependent alcohol dehydrogenase [Rhodococcus triatomae]QNG21880.1 NDMA-dependent alcohol dehydrogenase [Rhodococcus triatomae]
MKTKGAILWGLNEQWSVEEIELGDPVAGEVQLRMEAAGMCHSDHHLVTGATPMPSFPVMGGHEGAGVVTKIGPGVEDLEVGDHVVLSFIPACGKCPSCSAGHQNLCDLGAGLLSGLAISDGTYRIQARGENVIPMCLLGTFSPYMTVHQSSVVKIDKDIPFEVAALVGCGVPTGWGSATNIAEVKAGESVAIIGVGGVGMSALQGAVASGAREVFAIDPVAFKRDQAVKFGATHVFASVAEAIEPIMNLTQGRMADKTIITVGEMKGEYVDPALTLTSKAGRCVVTAMGNMGDMDVKLNLFLLSMLQKEVRGNVFGGCSARVEIPNLLALYKSGQLNLDDMITRTYSLEEVNDGYRDMLDGKNIRGVVRYTEADW